MDLIDRISRLLKEEKGIVCKPNWLGACIEWIIQEEQMVHRGTPEGTCINYTFIGILCRKIYLPYLL